MRPPRAIVAALVALAATVVGGCSVGAGESNSEGASLTVTRDFGRQVLFDRRFDTVPGGETVMRLLQRNADVDTSYGGRFVDAIEGVRSESRSGERRDWFYYVNGIEAGVGAAERDVAGGDRVWWDYRDWSVAMRVPAVVGSFPEPFVHGSEGKRFPVRIDCASDAADECDQVATRLERAGVDASTTAIGTPAGDELLRLVVGRWEQVRHDNATELIERGPTESGVFASVGRDPEGYVIDVLDVHGSVVKRLRAGSGIVAATRFEKQQPTWTVSGTDEAGLARAVRLIDARLLHNRYALAATAEETVPLPGPERRAP